MNKKELLLLMNRYDIDYLESLLVKVFLNRNKIQFVSNEIISTKIKGVKDGDIDSVDNYLKKINGEFNLKALERAFELLIEERERKLNGAFYTPNFIVDYITEIINKENPSICDYSCGSGAFLVGSAEKIHKLSGKSYKEIIEKNLYGIDISQRSIERAKIILSLLCLVNEENPKNLKFNLVVGDSLSLDQHKLFPNIFQGKRGFDYVLGNPPYVRIQNLSDEAKEKIREKWSSAKKYNVDLYIPFIELSLNSINKTGKVCLIVSKSFLDTDAGKEIRKIIVENRYLTSLIDFNFFQLFEDVITYTCILSLDKIDKESFEYYKIKDKDEINYLKGLKFRKISYSDVSYDKFMLNGAKVSYNINIIKNQPNKIGNLYDVRIGIATLRDDLYLIEKAKGLYVKEYKKNRYKIEKGIIKKILLANYIKSRNPKKKTYGWIIFPYLLKNGKYEIMEENYLKDNFPNCYSYFENIKDELMRRDKGRERTNNYGAWYAYGRVQGYNAIGNKIVCPNMMPEPRFEKLKNDSLFVAGYAIVCKKDIDWLYKILNSKIFWYYASNQGKKIRNEFYVIDKKILQDFAFPELTDKEKFFLKEEEDSEKIEDFLAKKYNLSI